MGRNTNCLEGIRCPSCGQEDHFIVTATVDLVLTDEGTGDIQGSVEYDLESTFVCGECGYRKQLAAFQVDDQPDEVDG